MRNEEFGIIDAEKRSGLVEHDSRGRGASNSKLKTKNSELALC